VPFTGSWAGELLHSRVRFGTFHTSRPLEICLVLARQMPHQIARQGPSGHQMVRLHSLSILIPPVKLMHYTDPLFYMHHAVSNN
jgi:hypothetical protein